MKKKLWLATALLLALLLLVCACNGGTTDGGTTDGGTTDGGTTDGGTTDGGTHTHTPGEWLVDQAPTCMKTGTRHRECTVCGKTLSTETLPVDPSAHKLTATADDTYLYASCAEDGCTAAPSTTAHHMIFSVSGGNATLTGYTGSAASVVIPTTYNGSPVTSIGFETFAFCSSLMSITIPNSVTSIGKLAFYSCESLTSITIPDSVTSIGSDAFSGCSGLTSITIPDSVTSIGSYAFAYCDSLTSITIPNSVTSIGDEAFRDCDGLTSITIPNSVTSIGDYAFLYCDSLTSIHFNGTKAQWNAISKGYAWNSSTGAYKIYCTDGTLSK